MREDPWPDALEDVVAGSRDHLGVALGGLGWIGIRCRPWLGETEGDANYERGLVFSGS